MQVVLSAINSKYIHTGLGLRYVGEYAKTQGHEVTLIEETINTPILAVLEKIMAGSSRINKNVIARRAQPDVAIP